jgi:hypothetical protein
MEDKFRDEARVTRCQKRKMIKRLKNGAKRQNTRKARRKQVKESCRNCNTARRR